MATLVEEINGKGGVVHQVFPNPRKVDHDGYIMRSELSSWPDPGKHQDLFNDVRIKTKNEIAYSHEVNGLPRH